MTQNFTPNRPFRLLPPVTSCLEDKSPLVIQHRRASAVQSHKPSICRPGHGGERGAVPADRPNAWRWAEGCVEPLAPLLRRHPQYTSLPPPQPQAGLPHPPKGLCYLLGITHRCDGCHHTLFGKTTCTTAFEISPPQSSRKHRSDGYCEPLC